APPPAPAPGVPTAIAPANGAAGVAVTTALSWSASGATTYDVTFGATNPPTTLIGGLVTATYTPAALADGTTYYWQVVPRNAAGATTGPIWSFSTAITAPATPTVVSPADQATGVAVNTSVAWSASGATSYDIKFGATNPPPSAATGLVAAGYTPTGLTNGT